MNRDDDINGAAEDTAHTRRALLARTRHELRTPLNAVIGYSEMLLEDACQKGRTILAPDLYKIHEAGLRLVSLVNDILEPSKIEAGMLDSESDQLRAAMRHRLRGPLDVVVACSGALTELAKSTNFTDYLEDLTHIREAGMGLIRILEDDGNFPAGQSNPSGFNTKTNPMSGVLGSVFAPTPSVWRQRVPLSEGDIASLLVVDDNGTNRDILSRYLQRHGHQVTPAAGGREALALLSSRQFDLILLDIVMPDMNGYQVLEKLKADAALCQVPVIFISALDDTLGKVEALRAGGVDYVTKPFRAEEVIARVENQLKLSRLQKDLALQNQELMRKNDELNKAQQRTDMVFSALTQTLPGTVLDGKYRLDEKIGTGGFGAVYRGMHLGLDLPVAIKIFRPMAGNDTSDALERFRQEGIAASRIKHPNTVEILDNGISSTGIAYLVMELLEGRTLATDLREHGILTLQRTAEILLPVCEALAEFHAAGIVHRDIKPSNIFLHQGRKGEVIKLLDFGMSKMCRPVIDQSQEITSITGSLAGTPAYMAPERLLNRSYDGRADVYSLGVILYQMLCGKLPFQSAEGSDFEQVMMQLTENPHSLQALNPYLPSSLDALASRMLAKDPESRPAAKELALLIKASLSA